MTHTGTMNWSMYILLPAVFLLTSFQSSVVTPDSGILAVDPCENSNGVFQHGEKIVYKIYYNWNFIWIAAGEVVFEVKEDGDHYHISAEGRTFKSYDWVFKVRDTYDSFVEKETLLPERTIRKVEEGNYRLYDDVAYNHAESLALSKKGKSKNDLSEESILLEKCTHDILSSIYMMRNIDFQSMPKGSTLPLSIYLDRKIYDIDVVYAGIEQEKRVRGVGKCNTLLFKPKLVVGNIFKDNEGMNVWVSNDENRIPLMIESPISVGSVKVVLKSYKGLKYDPLFELP